MVSIQKYGFNDPIGIWSDKNIIVEGHGRLAAAKKLHMKEVPVIRLDHLTDEQRKEYAIIHNKTAELSEWDFDLLAEDIPTLDFSGFDIDWGLSGVSIENIDQEILNPEEPIARELNEANNYIVLEFNTETDWDDAQKIFGLERVQTADTNVKIRRHGIGRVIDGAEVMRRLVQNEN